MPGMVQWHNYVEKNDKSLLHCLNLYKNVKKYTLKLSIVFK